MYQLLIGDVLDQLASLEAGSVDCVVTSPPYWGLRDYNTDGQIGLEATPDEYVQTIVRVFREVRRVLAGHGTCWVNLGDSYANSPGSAVNRNGLTGSLNAGRADFPVREANIGHCQPMPPGLKPKDLVGIPWRVALALQQPWYAGKITDERERIWLAAVIEAEGCLFIHKRKEGQHNGQGYYRKQASYGPGLEVSSTDRVIVERCLAITGLGSICEQSPDQNARRKQTLYRWNLRTTECRDVICELYPHMIAKQHEARLLIGCPSSGPKAEAAHESLKAIHQGGMPSIDFPAPESMHEGGWYLRSDVIWSKKPNPMPESVTDRPTKAHEYVFLLTKRARYYFDQDAVREPHIYGGKRDSNGSWPLDEAGRPGPDGAQHLFGNPAGRNLRTVWNIPTHPYPGAHFATFPPKLVERCILAGCPKGGTVLDPFVGSGTTMVVALRNHRDALGIELNPDYAELARRRLERWWDDPTGEPETNADQLTLLEPTVSTSKGSATPRNDGERWNQNQGRGF